MKKILFTALAFCSFAFANAQGILEVAPLATVAGDDVASTDKVLTFNVVGDATKYISMQFSLCVPEGIEVDYEFFIEGEGLPTNRGKLMHTIAADQVASDMPGYNMYTFLVYDTKKTHFVGNELFSVYCGTTSDVAEGVYPIYLKDVKLAVSTVGDDTDLVPSYIKIGEPTGKTYAPQGPLSPAVNDALASETAISKLDLTGVTAAYGTFAYVDGREVVAPEGVTVEKATYTRAAGTSEYASLCLPFDAELNAYALASSSDVEAVFDETGVVAAGESYLVDGTAAINVEAANVALASAENKDVTSGVYLKGGKLWSVNESATIPAFRGCWDIAAGANLRIVVNGTTGINALEAESADKAFDLQGRRVQNAKSGVYVVNGKKQIVK